MMDVRSRVARSVLAAGVVCWLYVGAYALLSLGGSMDWDGPKKAWHAAACWRSVPMPCCCADHDYEPTPLGLVFYPVALADQAWWHKSQWYIVSCF